MELTQEGVWVTSYEVRAMSYGAVCGFFFEQQNIEQGISNDEVWNRCAPPQNRRTSLSFLYY